MDLKWLLDRVDWRLPLAIAAFVVLASSVVGYSFGELDSKTATDVANAKGAAQRQAFLSAKRTALPRGRRRGRTAGLKAGRRLGVQKGRERGGEAGRAAGAPPFGGVRPTPP